MLLRELPDSLHLGAACRHEGWQGSLGRAQSRLSTPLLDWGFPSGSSDKEFTCKSGDVRDVVLFPRLGLSPEGGHGNPLLYSCLESPMDRGVCSAIVHSVTKSGTRLKQLNTHALSLIIRESLVLSVRHFQFCVTLHLPKSIPPI